MIELFYNIADYFKFGFVRYALVVSVLIALSSALLGVTLVLKRFSFIGDGLSHVAFGAMSIALVIGFVDNMLIVLPITVICAVLILRVGQNAKIRGDAVIAMISVGALAVGYLILNIFSPSANLTGDVCGTLFGSTKILTLTKRDVVVSIVLSLLVLGFFIFFYNKIFAVTFDENFARATGIRTGAYNTLMAIVVAVVIVLAMNLIGTLLISALIVFPALSAMRIFKNYRSTVIFSCIISVFCAAAGIIISLAASTPVGATIVTVNIAAFGICSAVGLAVRR